MHTRDGGSVRPTVVVDALAARYGGTAKAAIEITRRLARDPEIESVIAVAHGGSTAANALASDVRTLVVPSRVRGELIHRLAWEGRHLPKLIAETPNAKVLSWSGMLPRAVGGSLVCYLSNLLLLTRDDPVNRLRRWAARRTARSAAHILVPSEAMARMAEPILRRRCEVVPRGVSSETFFPAPKAGTEILYVADFYPHKRHELLLEAWTKLDAPRPTLRMIGDPSVDPGGFRHIRQMVEKLGSSGSIVLEGPLGPDKVADAYRRARLVALPSSAESFCLPVAEAQASGVPVVASDIPALRETGSGAATYIASSSAEEWARAMTELLENDHLHEVARTAGVANASRFSWDAAAETVRDRLIGKTIRPADDEI